MFFRILIAVFFMFALPANAQDIRSIHPISDVYVAQFQRNAISQYWITISPIDSDIASAIRDTEAASQFLFGEEGVRTFKIVPDGVNRYIWHLMTNDPSLTMRAFDSSSSNDREIVSREFQNGNHLFACSNHGSEYRLYAFRENSPEVFLWQNFMIPRNRTYFHTELEEFNRRGSYYLDLGRGQSNETYALPGNTKFRVRDINQCYAGAWVAVFNNSPDFSGRAFTFQARDLALLWDKVEEYRRDGIYLVDIEKGQVEGSEGGVLWYAVFSDNERYENDTIWRVFLNSDAFVSGIDEMETRGYSVTDLEIASRGSL